MLLDVMKWRNYFCDDDDDDNLFSIPEIRQSGYTTCHYITTGKVQNESLK